MFSHSVVRRELPNALKIYRSEKLSHDEEKLARREEAVQRQLVSTVDRCAYTYACMYMYMPTGMKECGCEGASGVNPNPPTSS